MVRAARVEPALRRHDEVGARLPDSMGNRQPGKLLRWDDDVDRVGNESESIPEIGHADDHRRARCSGEDHSHGILAAADG